jgi:hypothetical protein
MSNVGREDVLEMAAAEDEQPVDALAADRPNPALGVRSRLRRPYRRLDHTDPRGAEDLVEVARELAVTVTDEEQRADVLVVEAHQQVARLLSHPAATRIRGDPGQVHATGSPAR